MDHQGTLDTQLLQATDHHVSKLALGDTDQLTAHRPRISQRTREVENRPPSRGLAIRHHLTNCRVMLSSKEEA